MKKILAFKGSPRKSGNSSILLESFINGVIDNKCITEIIDPYNLNLKNCTGCLRCNILKRCSVIDDDWPGIAKKIEESNVLVFSSPVYFHHVPAALKIIINRFRSFVNVHITKTGLNHIPWKLWNKNFVLILTMGSSDVNDAKPVIELFEFITSILGKHNNLHVIAATRLAMANQINKNEKELIELYKKLNLSSELAIMDYITNKNTLQKCYDLGLSLTKK